MKKKSFTLLMIFWVVIIGFIMNPINIAQGTAYTNKKLEYSDSIPTSALLNGNNARVAIYDENNLTSTDYDLSGGDYNNNVTQLKSMLETAGFEVTLMTTADIYDHQLLTAKFDCFIIADNTPRENITNFVKEFWLGGGSILAFDSAVSYLCYFGILPLASTGDDGRNVYWKFLTHNVTIKNRHPISKSYNFDDIITVSSTGYNYMAWNWTKLQTTSVADEVTFVAQADDDPEFASVLAFDPTLKGGKIVTIGYDLASESVPAINNMIIDSINWLVPHPKGRILFDYSHFPYYGVDPWDALSGTPGQYETLRNDYVARKYTFDKLYPSVSGNFTTENLAPYDLMITLYSEYNYSVNEISVVEDWISNGGGLLVFGDTPLIDINYPTRINNLLGSYGMAINLTETSNEILSDHLEHPTSESCVDINPALNGLINCSGSAYALWNTSSSQTVIATNEYGNGRVILIADINLFDDIYIGDDENEQFAINVANWLTSDNARVLLYTDSPLYNYYQSPEVLALNELGIPFHLTSEIEAFNLSLYRDSWDLVIFNNMNFGVSTYFDEVLTYMESGGNLIFCTYNFDSTDGFELWDYLGFEYGDEYLISPPDIYLWDQENTLFNYPINYKGLTISTVETLYAIDYMSLIPHDNGTAIAGVSPFFKDNNSAIILGANGRAITNGMLLSNYQQDSDDSSYSDALEIWTNQITYLVLPPQAPMILTGDQTILTNQTSVEWTEMQNADSYRIYIENNGTTNLSTNGFEHMLEFSGNGTYLISMTALNENGESESSNEITITVEITEVGFEDLGDLLDSLSDLNTIIWMVITGGGVLMITLIIPGIVKLIKKKKGKKNK